MTLWKRIRGRPLGASVNASEAFEVDFTASGQQAKSETPMFRSLARNSAHDAFLDRSRSDTILYSKYAEDVPDDEKANDIAMGRRTTSLPLSNRLSGSERKRRNLLKSRGAFDIEEAPTDEETSDDDTPEVHAPQDKRTPFASAPQSIMNALNAHFGQDQAVSPQPETSFRDVEAPTPTPTVEQSINETITTIDDSLSLVTNPSLAMSYVDRVVSDFPCNDMCSQSTRQVSNDKVSSAESKDEACEQELATKGNTSLQHGIEEAFLDCSYLLQCLLKEAHDSVFGGQSLPCITDDTNTPTQSVAP